MRQLVSEKENSELKPVKLRLKIDIVSYPARAEGLVNSTIRRFSIISRTFIEGVETSEKMQSVYCSAPADWVEQ